MMRELDQVNSVSLAVVGVDLLAALQIIEAHTEVFTAGDQVLAIMADVNRVDLLFLHGEKSEFN